ncbi:hypothetical protein EOA32_10990 [Mesorhizobium sp. M1A.F.Ca.ET.072.01.1.1]|uniref:hypothetical protein n=1 Tax=Mesorhizobium sp. M1A.F.Ca.ET.072.01.1.1 TaxID=2496753 RepID=UPI000FD55299|nr:hypothetical protein [Mesorhizobium sp. M1A.F.Ca.ET.072.01.1.1]RUW53000.1 hypothetical protein EOA32_10990 [Mesorhizobium sp. M1A.F.Ca.ET.072.01.1.1]TIV04346.1 MAG: hypothetical protein E5W04_03965 [Mesorhizobium sp.]
MHDLNLPTIADGQADSQWQTSNDGDAAIANALADILTVDFSGGDVTLTSAQFRSAMTFVPSGLSATRALTVPAVKRALFFVHNTDGADSITVTRGSTTVSVEAGKLGVFYTDGTTNGLVGAIVATGTGGATASTTEVLTGTDTGKIVTPDALAALWEKGSDVASAGTVSLGEGGYFHITGTTTITDIDWATAKDGRPAWIIFDGALTLTHNATTLKLPGGANITTAAGDRAMFVQDSSDNVICLAYVRADGTPLVGAAAGTPFEMVVACSDESTALTTGTAKVSFRIPRGVTLTAVRASLVTAQSSGSIFTVDINEGGTTILSTKLTIDNTELTSTTAATPAVISDASLADDALITVDIDQVGDGTAKGLKVTLIGTRT